MSTNQKEIVEELKIEWKRLWRERLDDKVRAEGIAIHDYSSLFIDKGTIIHATRDFKAIHFKDILDQHQVPNPERYVPLDPQIGGWTKFVKDKITKKPSNTLNKSTEMEFCFGGKKIKQQLRKQGRGWLHL